MTQQLSAMEPYFFTGTQRSNLSHSQPDLPPPGVKPRGIATVTPSAPYSLQPPSPPAIHVDWRGEDVSKMDFLPSQQNLSSLGLTAEEFGCITHAERSQAVDYRGDAQWTYEQRRTAQRIVDWLYLGPSPVTRDKEFLQREGITMVLAVRYMPNSGTVSNLSPYAGMGSTVATRELGIHVDAVQVASDDNLPANFMSAIRRINSHVLEHRTQQSSSTNHAQPGVTRHTGKVLVICETGNARSGAVVAAYLIAMFGIHMSLAIAYLSARRFSVSLDEETKRQLITFHDILKAHQDVRDTTLVERENTQAAPQGNDSSRQKRGIDETFGDEDGNEGNTALTAGQAQASEDDHSRFGNRTFVPFTDVADTDRMMS